MNSLKEKLSQEIEKLVLGTHFHLMEIKISPSKRFTGIQIFLDRDDGYFSLQDCRNWSELIQDLIDRNDMILKDYRLEVSSPGIGRSLKERWEYAKNLEKRLYVVYRPSENEIADVSGDLINVSDDGIGLLIGKNQLSINWAQIQRASVKTLW